MIFGKSIMIFFDRNIDNFTKKSSSIDVICDELFYINIEKS